MAEDNKNKPAPAQNQINIELSEEIAEGIYSNLAMIAHSNSEFVIDFIRLMPGVPKAKVKSRIVITPEHAKRFLLALKDNIEKYENSFGVIKRTDDMPKFPMNFGGTVGEASIVLSRNPIVLRYSGSKFLVKGFVSFVSYDTFAVLILKGL